MKFLVLLLSVLLIGIFSIAHVIVDPNSKYIAAVLESGEGVEIWINTRKHWELKQSLIDGYETEQDWQEVNEITDKLSLCTLADAQFEPCRNDRSIEELEKGLLSQGVMLPEEFKIWAEGEL